ARRVWFARGGLEIAFLLYAGLAIIAAAYIFHQLIDDALAGPQQGKSLEYRLVLATLLGALGLPLLFHRAWINSRQTHTAEQGHVTERIIKATELLGATKEQVETVTLQGGRTAERREIQPNVEVRIGAIYTLERVARESLPDHLTIMDLLAAYIRQNYQPKPAEATQAEPAAESERSEASPGAPQKPLQEPPQEIPGGKLQEEPEFEIARPREDVLAALRVILRRSAAQIGEEERLRRPFRWQDTPLAYADISELFSASGPDDRPWALPFAQLERANLRGANLWSANLKGSNLKKAKLTHAHMGSATLENATLESATLQKANLKSAELWSADLKNALLNSANLDDAKLWFANLECAKLDGANLRQANLGSANLKRADLRGANLLRANLEGAALDGATLVGVYNLRIAQLAYMKNSGERGGLDDNTPLTEYQKAEILAKLTVTFADARLAKQLEAAGITPPAHWPTRELGFEEAESEWRQWLAARDHGDTDLDH
ncbi:MAG: pentapeptide repeat-containing protein, partial [Neomegalonema sp.]|nr:pentapeptide repeat-containing protein [Neomegalonema sp.]